MSKPTSTKEFIEAYETGKRLMAQANAEAKEFMRSYYEKIPQLVEQSVFRKLKNHADIPPLVLARMDVKLWIDRLDNELKPRLLTRLRNAMMRWITLPHGVGDDCERIVDFHYNNFKRACALSAVKFLIERLDEIRVMDAAWRAANPEKSADIPENTFAAELDAAIEPCWPPTKSLS